MSLLLQILHSVCRIADVLLLLQQAGNVRYTRWMYQAPCSTDEGIISTLQSQAKRMEEELRQWKKTVLEARNKFYELNYFTTIQLLLLRQELGAMNAAFGNANVPSNILALLRSISFNITSENVCRVVKNLVADPSLVIGSPNHEESCVDQNERTLKTAILAQPVQEERIEKPKLQEDELTDEQKGIMTFVVQRLSCSKLLVLKAFEINQGKEMNKYEYKKWCIDHLTKYRYEDEDEYLSEEDSVSQQSSEETDNELPYFTGKFFLVTCNSVLMFYALGRASKSQAHGNSMSLPADVTAEAAQLEIDERQSNKVITEAEDMNLNWYVKHISLLMEVRVPRLLIVYCGNRIREKYIVRYHRAHS